MPRNLLPIAAICLLLAACNQGAKEQTADNAMPDATPLLKTDQAFAKLSADSGAVAAYRMYLADNAVQMPSGTPPIVGRDSIVASMASGPQMTLLWEPKHAEVARSGDLGWTWGVYQVKLTNESGEQISSSGKYVNVWRKDDSGQWKVVVDMGNSGS